jgi:hypothetical protein
MAEGALRGHGVERIEVTMPGLGGEGIGGLRVTLSGRQPAEIEVSVYTGDSHVGAESAPDRITRELVSEIKYRLRSELDEYRAKVTEALVRTSVADAFERLKEASRR